MANELVTIAEFANEFEAGLAKVTLETKGIDAVIVGDQLPFGGLVSEAAGVQLQVRTGDAEKARQILQAEEVEGDKADE